MTTFISLGIISIISQTIIARELAITFWGNEFFIGLTLAFWLLFTALGAIVKIKVNPKLLYVLAGVFLLLEFLFIRHIGQNIILGILSIFPLCFILGLWFKNKTENFSTSRAYFLEIIGFVIGGIIIAVVLIYSQPIIDSVPFLKKIDSVSASWRFKNQELIRSVNSPLGNIAVIKTDGQLNFYGNGVLLGSTKDFELSEQIAHLTLLQKENPRDILLIGGGFGNILPEIVKHNPEKIVYVEPDPKIIELMAIPPKVTVINQDGYYYLNNNQEQFDAIIINLPNPSTALINRFYTKEFFEKLKQNLKDQGIITTHLLYTESSANSDLETLNSLVLNTLKSVFLETLVLKDRTSFFFAGAVENNPDVLIKRLKERNIETKFLNEQYINYLFSQKEDFNQSELINENFRPIAYFYQTLFWLDMFSTNLSRMFKHIAENFWFVFLALLMILTILHKNKKNPVLAVAIAGFSLMAFEIIIIFVYQTTVGYLFTRISLLISAVTLGMALGLWFGIKTKKGILNFQFLTIVFCLIFAFFLCFFLNEVIIIALAAVAGFLGGVIFPIANKSYVGKGSLYAADLIGACLGSIIPSLILIPVFGLWQTLLFIAILNFWIIIIS